jgi:CSLREA domain-containing protein
MKNKFNFPFSVKISVITVLIISAAFVFGAGFRHLTTLGSAQTKMRLPDKRLAPDVVITVNSNCSLSNAIDAANTNLPVGGCAAGSPDGADRIMLPAGTITLTAVNNTDPYEASPNGLPAIRSTIIIQGAGADSTIIERSAATNTPNFRLFYVAEPGNFDPNLPRLTINGVTLRNGKIPAGHFGMSGGAAIHPHQGWVEINDCRFENNTAARSGGAVNTFGNLTINNSSFTGNTAGEGGAIFAVGATISNSTFTNNASQSAAGGAVSGGTLSITGSAFTGNTVLVEAPGGALYGNTINVSNSIFTGNSAPYPSSNGRGGAIYGVYVTITGSTISGNTAGGYGGGVSDSSGGNSFVAITGSTISNNTSGGNGGGLSAVNLTVNNSTVSGNSAKESGGGLVFNGSGGSLSLNNATISNNTADSDNNGSGIAGGIFHSYSFSQSPTMNIRNSIIAGNFNAVAPDCAVEYGGTIFSQGYNLIGNNTGCNFMSANGDLVGTSAAPINPQLAPLAENGGATRTHALLANSPAIDAANPVNPDGTGNSCLSTDQRSAARPGDGDDNGTFRCDIGAFEIVEQVATSLSFTAQPSNAIAGANISPAVQVAVLDQFGAVKTDATDAVTISLAANPSGDTLGGTLTRNAVGGIATFDDLNLNRSHTGYTLRAAAGSMTAATSSSFNIAPAEPAQLVFAIQPTSTSTHAVIGPVLVEVQDQFSNTVTSATDQITLALDNNPGNAVLSGTLTRSAVSGIAVFNDLRVTQIGDGFTLKASAGTLTQAVSVPFNIYRPIFFVTKTDDTDDGICNEDCSLREAVTAANTLSGDDTIRFDIPGNGPFTIMLSSNLPDITSPVTIDGTSQRGHHSTPVVGINGSLINSDAVGFRILADNTVIRGLLVSGFGAIRSYGIIVSSNYNEITGNYIGTDFSGTSALPNGWGILINGSNNIIGGAVSARNLISGNLHLGISIAGNDNKLWNNYIGTDASGSNPLSNGIGIDLVGEYNIVGGGPADQRNVISGNDIGIRIIDNFNLIAGNIIGRNAWNTADNGNTRGVVILHFGFAYNNSITDNIISGNLSYGIHFIGVSDYFAPSRNLIRRNTMNGNGGLGIAFTDLGTALPNDPRDNDDGHNRRQNYPVLDSADLSGGNFTIQGSLNSTPDKTFRLEFFSNTACDPSGYGEGETPLGTMDVTTDAGGIVGFTATLPSVVSGGFITATATDPHSNTSEFSRCIQVVEHPFSISGRITDSANLPLANLKVNLSGSQSLSTVTDGAGNYSFENLPDGVYTVTPVSTLYDFTPPSRTYTNPVGDQTNQNFSGVNSRYRVTGVVRADCNGALTALGQVNLTVSNSANLSAQTDASGGAFFDLPPAGSYVLTPAFGDYTFNPPSINLPNPLTGDQTFEFIAQAPVPLCTKLATSEGSGGVKVMNADGSAFAQLPAAGSYAFEPDLSRDGSRLTFVENDQIFVADSDGTSRIQLTSGDARKHLPRISPDKTKIVYQSQPAGSSGGARLNLINLVNNTISTINTNPQAADQDLEPSWSPDGTKIVFHRIHRPGGVLTHNIFSINADGTNLAQLTNSTSAETNGSYSEPDYSPDGTKITFIKKSGSVSSIMVMNADGSNLTAVSTPASVLGLAQPRWSPDGTKIAFIETFWSGSSYRRLIVINADGTGRRQIREGLFGGLSWAAQYRIPTAAGANVMVESGGVSLNFAGISAAGQTAVTPISPFSAGNTPGGFVLAGSAYEITTTAPYSAPVTVCFNVPESTASTETQFNALSLMHSENGVLVDRTTSRNFVQRQICGTVDSLSPFALAQQVDDTKPKISGIVLDADGNPMSGVKMFLSGAETLETDTGTDGTFQFVNLISGANYNVQPKQLGFIFNSYSKDFINLSGEETVIFTGTANSFSISGNVTGAGGNGMSGVLVKLNGSFSADTSTDANGSYTFSGLPADGSYSIKVFNGVNNFTPAEATIAPLLSNATDVNFVQIAPTAAHVAVSGRILSADGRGIRNAVVTMTDANGQSKTYRTGTFGVYRFENVQAGQIVIITVSAKGFVFPQPSQVLNVSGDTEDLNFTATNNE